MAGIGFELKKLYGEDKGITRTIGAMGYSVVTTIGPTILIVAALIASNLLMSYWKIGEAEKMTFSGALLYCFVGALVISSVFDTVLSRYVSDCIFSDKDEKLLPCAQGATAMFAALYGIVGTIFALLLYFVSGLGLYYVIVIYFTLMGVGLTFGISVFVTAIKAYKNITLAYLFGSILIIVVAALCYLLGGLPIGESMMTGFAVGFMTIAIMLYLYLHKAFPRGDGSYFEFFGHVSANKYLLISGLFYVLGLYAHNMVFWFNSDLQLVVGKILYSAPAYDMAGFVAMLTSISSVVIFVVRVETNFYTRYKEYCEAVIGNNLRNVDLSREKMNRTLVNEVYFVGEFQIIITIVLMVLSITFLPLIGIGGTTLDIYPILALGYYAVFMMHIVMIFLYYFDDQKGAAAVGVGFFLMTLVFTLLTKYLGIQFYGLGLVFSGVLSWVFAFIRLKEVVKNVDYKMFCDNVRVRDRQLK